MKALASALDRDYKRVYEDVMILENAGLVVREEGRLSAPWDALTAEVSLQLNRETRSGIRLVMVVDYATMLAFNATGGTPRAEFVSLNALTGCSA